MILTKKTQNTALFLSFLMLFVSFVFILLIPFPATAQIVTGLKSVLILDTNPTYPGPNERVTVSAESFSIDLNNSTVSWFVDGVLKQQIIGGTTFQFTTNDLGKKTEIDIVAETSSGSLETEKITIRPTDADIIWEGNTFTHPLYKGKRTPSVGSTINVEVIPYFVTDTGTRLSSQELTYLWRIDGQILPKASGRGKNTILITQMKPVRSIQTEVEIQSPDKTLSRKERLSIPVRDSELLIYENNPLLGILFNKTINSLYSLIGQETKFIAYPFFMSVSERSAPHVDYIWSIDGNPITLGEDRSSITVSHTGSDEGNAEIVVSTQNTRDIFQRSDTNFIIEFGKNTSSGFGF